jgi:hypothetical protein
MTSRVQPQPAESCSHLATYDRLVPQHRAENEVARRLICWTRMQAEAGQALPDIIARKEIERRACGGQFFWGVGNAPSRLAPALAQAGHDVEVIFSVMKSKPKTIDQAPSSVLVWRCYIDLAGRTRPLPRGILVMSRGSRSGEAKERHYALVCQSSSPLRIGDLGPFSPTNYRNAGGTNAPVGASQVTALLELTSHETIVTDYRINMRARLAGGFWVKLADPVELSGQRRTALSSELRNVGEHSANDWIELVDDLRRKPSCRAREQLALY